MTEPVVSKTEKTYWIACVDAYDKHADNPGPEKKRVTVWVSEDEGYGELRPIEIEAQKFKSMLDVPVEQLKAGKWRSTYNRYQVIPDTLRVFCVGVKTTVETLRVEEPIK